MVFLQEGRSRRNSFLQDIRKWTPLCTIFWRRNFCVQSYQSPPFLNIFQPTPSKPHALFVPTFPPFVQQVIRLPPAAEEWKCGGRQQPPFCLQPNILPRPKPAPAFARSQLARRAMQNLPAGCPDCTCALIFCPAARHGVPRNTLAPLLSHPARSPCN